jgi:hypothetical protein
MPISDLIFEWADKLLEFCENAMAWLWEAPVIGIGWWADKISDMGSNIWSEVLEFLFGI